VRTRLLQRWGSVRPTRLALAVCFFHAGAVQAQLIPAGTPVPRTLKPPVVFVEGYIISCGTTFSHNFGNFDQLFQATSRVSLLFDNCVFSGKPSIEELGNNFRDFLAALKYTDGTPVTQVDIVAHSMGGLIVRSYLAGKQTAAGVFQPPVNTGIRKAVFLATPNFGSSVASFFGIDIQTDEMSTGSFFTFDLATWNQGTDDLRGIDALALVGNDGTGLAVMGEFDDGVVSLTSGSIGFAIPGRTRVLPYCHNNSGFVTAAFLCPPGAPGIAQGKAATDANAAIVLSFLNDTPDWQTIGQAAEQNKFLSIGGGLSARAKSSSDQFVAIQKATASKTLNVNNNAIAWTEFLPAQVQNLTLTTGAGTLQKSVNLPAGYISAVTAKNGPNIARVLPAAGAIQMLNVAPGMFVAIYGTGLAAGTTIADPLPYPTTLGGVQVMVAGTPIGLHFVSPSQINAVLPAIAKGLVTFTVSNADGTHTVNVLVQPAAPAIFTQDSTGTGPAAALNGLTSALVTAAAPLQAGDYVSLYLTGLGTAHLANGLPVADQQPSVTVGGIDCPVLYAGQVPGFAGLDQINCRIPSGIAPSSSAPVVVTSGGRSNLATLSIW